MDIFQTLADATNPNKKPFNRLLDIDKEPEQHPYVKKAYLSYHDDIVDDLQPDITLTPDCQKGYIGGFLAGMAEGLAMADRLHEQIYSPTINRYEGTGITDKNNFEAIN